MVQKWLFGVAMQGGKGDKGKGKFTESEIVAMENVD
jgi:hypothetical protein